MNIPSCLARVALFAALAYLCHLATDPTLRDMLFAILIVFSLRVLFAPNLAYPHDRRNPPPSEP